MKKSVLLALLLLVNWTCINPKQKESALQRAKQSLKHLSYSMDAWAQVWKFKTYDKQSEAYNDFIRQFEALTPAERDSLFKHELSLGRRQVETFDIPDVSTAALVPGNIQFCTTVDNAPITAKKAFAEYFPLLFDKVKDTKVFLTFYVIKKTRGDETMVNRQKLDQQVIILNKAFKDIKVSFEIKNIIEKENTSQWYSVHPIDNNLGDKIITELDNSIPIVINGYKAIYGNAPFPWGSEYRTSRDFIFLYDGTLPGNSATLSDGRKRLMEGKTLVHEIGHYLGLYHIFHQLNPGKLNCNDVNYGSCDEIGDRVKDTPRQRICYYESGFCNATSNKECASNTTQSNCIPCKSCGDEPAMVDNFMGYNTDDVRKQFTKGQLLRMLTHLYYGDRYYLIVNNIDI